MTINTHTFPNGFRIATESIPNFKTVALGIWIKVGGRHETKDQNGIAHFLEHMAFKGTNARTSLDIAEALENVGGYMNAYTSREITNYYCRIMSEDTPLALDVISDIVLNSTLAQDDLELERNVILQEIGQTNDTPDDIIFDWLQATAYPNQPYGRSILGPTENVQKFSRQDLVDFTKKHYTPDRMILCASGDVDHEKLIKLCENYFKDLRETSNNSVVPGNFVGGETRVRKSLEQAHFALAFKAPSVKSPNIFAGQIFSIAMGGGMSSKLFQEIREKRGLCYSIFSSLEAGMDTGSLTIYSGTSEDKIAELARVVIEEIKRSVESISEKDLNKARAQLKAGILMSLESTSNRCERLARTISVWDRVVPVNETIEKINTVSLVDLKDFAQKLCAGSQPAMALYGPINKAPRLVELENNLISKG